MAVIVLLAIGCVLWVTLGSETMVARWDETVREGKMGGRKNIFKQAWGMFLDKPLFGWWPPNHTHELGARLSDPGRSPHNLYLWVLIETGLLGAIPFFTGLWLCLRRAWWARASAQGIVPMVLIVFLFVVCLKGNYINFKIFWVILAYVAASGSVRPIRSVRRGRKLLVSQQKGKAIPLQLGSKA